MVEIKDEILNGDELYTLRDKQGNVIKDDVDISLKTPVLQQGTPINKALLLDIFGMDNYKQISLDKQVNASVTEKREIVGQLDNISQNKTWQGHSLGHIHEEELWDFNMTSDLPLRASGSSSYSVVWCYYRSIYGSGGDHTDLASFNKFLSNKAVSEYMFHARSYSEFTLTCQWDMKKSCSPIFHIRLGTINVDEDCTMWYEGSNNPAGPYTIMATTKLQGDLKEYTFPSSGSFRYHRVRISHKGTGQYKELGFDYMYFSDVLDTRKQYKNYFISDNNFEIRETANVVTPNFPNERYIIENYINNIKVQDILKPNNRYPLIKEGNILKEKKTTITGIFTAVYNQKVNINLGVKPKAVIIFSDLNSGEDPSSDRASTYFEGKMPLIVTDYVITGYSEIEETGFWFKAFDNAQLELRYVAFL